MGINWKPLTFALSLLCYLLLFFIVAGGFQFITGRAHPAGGIGFKSIGVVTVVAGIVVFSATIRRWSGYFFAVCFLAAAKALFALVLGYTISQPRLVVTRMQAAEVLAVLVAMGLLSFRYASRPPNTVSEIVSLLAAVAGLGGEVAFDPIIWPGVAGVLMLALPLLVNRRTLGAKAGAC